MLRIGIFHSRQKHNVTLAEAVTASLLGTPYPL
jgi:hypothetical protein